MLYIKPNGSDMIYSVITLTPFKTAHSYNAIRIVSELDIPIMSDGFILYQDDDKEVCDYSDYKYQYSKDSYSVVQDTNISGVPSNTPLPVSAFDKLSNRVSHINSQLNEITPITVSKPVYIGDTQCEFDLVKEGNINAWLVCGDTQMSCTFEVIENKIIVSFEELNYVGTVYVSVQ